MSCSAHFNDKGSRKLNFLNWKVKCLVKVVGVIACKQPECVLVCLQKTWGVPSNTAGIPKAWNVTSCMPAVGNTFWHSPRSQVRKQCWYLVLILTVSYGGNSLELLMVLREVFLLLLLLAFSFSRKKKKKTKLVLNKTLISWAALSFDASAYSSRLRFAVFATSQAYRPSMHQPLKAI